MAEDLGGKEVRGLKPEESSGHRHGCVGHSGAGKCDGYTSRSHSEELHFNTALIGLGYKT